MSCPFGSAPPSDGTSSSSRPRDDSEIGLKARQLQEENEELQQEIDATSYKLGGLCLGCRESFVTFLQDAVQNTGGPEHRRLYKHLFHCFADADQDLDGFIGADELDALLDVAAEAPWAFGSPPANDAMFISEQERVSFRQDLSTMIKLDKGSISFQEFAAWALTHIEAKVAASSNTCREYQDFYFHLLHCFTDADQTMTGVIDVEGFNKLLDLAAMEPRKQGFPPPSLTMSPDVAEQKALREAVFKSIDTDENGFIAFDKFLAWVSDQIGEKASGNFEAIDEDSSSSLFGSVGVPEGMKHAMYDDATSADDFAVFCAEAIRNRTSSEYRKLYYHLLRCFVDADRSLLGSIIEDQFDRLVDTAAVAPRKFGFAPKNADLYLSVLQRKQARADLFKRINLDGSGRISFKEFLRWAVQHIEAKILKGVKPWKAGIGRLSMIESTSPQDFTRFLSTAVVSTQSPEYQDLYYHLLRCFTDADIDMKGIVDGTSFDRLIHFAAMAPRKYGFAPPAVMMFNSEAERKASRAKMFRIIDREGRGYISFDMFLAWAVAHIRGKITGGARADYMVVDSLEDFSLEAKNLPMYDDAFSSQDFAEFCRAAIEQRGGSEYHKLYYHLLRCFVDADIHLQGLIGFEEFDRMIDVTAVAPRRFGFAPEASEMYSSVAERKRARAMFFKEINTGGSGKISFNEFLDWAVKHIREKVVEGIKPWKKL